MLLYFCCSQCCVSCVRAAVSAHLQIAEQVGDHPLVGTALDEVGDLPQRVGQVVGAVYTDDMLERIFSRFCIGK